MILTLKNACDAGRKTICVFMSPVSVKLFLLFLYSGYVGWGSYGCKEWQIQNLQGQGAYWEEFGVLAIDYPWTHFHYLDDAHFHYREKTALGKPPLVFINPALNIPTQKKSRIKNQTAAYCDLSKLTHTITCPRAGRLNCSSSLREAKRRKTSIPHTRNEEVGEDQHCTNQE